MTGHLFVQSPGLSTTLQDLGRFGYQDLGMPVSGALDHISLRFANALVGNPETTAALEIRMLGPVLRVEATSIRVALTGADAALEMLDGAKQSVPTWQSVRLERGQVFRVGPMRNSTSCYLAVEGGFAVPTQFGSRSTYARGQIGGFEGRALQAEDRLPLTLDQIPAHDEQRLSALPVVDVGEAIRVVLGPQDGHFTPKGVRALLGGTFMISHQADRMGLRLDGPPIEHACGYDIVSDGIATGSIQVPGTGKPIVLLADRQTTGGYPKIAVVASVDLPRLSRMGPGTALRFQAVSVEEAEEARRVQEREIKRLLDHLEPMKARQHLNSETLLATNLISGFVSIHD